MNRQLSSIPSAANIVDDPQGPVWTHGSPRRQSNLEVERLWFGVTGQYVRWMVTWIVPNINRLLSPSTFPTRRGVRFFNRMELLAIPQVPQWSFSAGYISHVAEMYPEKLYLRTEVTGVKNTHTLVPGGWTHVYTEMWELSELVLLYSPHMCTHTACSERKTVTSDLPWYF